MVKSGADGLNRTGDRPITNGIQASRDVTKLNIGRDSYVTTWVQSKQKAAQRPPHSPDGIAALQGGAA